MEIKLEDLLYKLLGNINICYETTHDDKVYKNLDNYEEALDYIIEQLEYASYSKKRPEYSAKKCGNKAYDLLMYYKERLEDLELELKAEEETENEKV